MIDVIVVLIAIGEISAGLFYCLAGLVFAINSFQANEAARAWFRGSVGLLFIVGGLEELADSVVQEGSGAMALWVQGILTALQVATGALAVWVLFRAKLLLRPQG